jgi:hypothetical protein
LFSSTIVIPDLIRAINGITTIRIRQGGHIDISGDPDRHPARRDARGAAAGRQRIDKVTGVAR